jgi:Na+/proline symporter
VAIHYFVIGAEWAFVQRYLCVPNPADARKGAYLFGLLYLISPILWLLPPLIQRVRSPVPAGASNQVVTALAESAYIDICQAVLPAGMIGLMLAAMFSATASMVSSQLNVFAGVLTNDIFQPCLKSQPNEHLLVWAGRGFTALIGAVIVGIALAVPAMGGAERVIVPATSLMVGPLLAPLLIGLLSKRLPAYTVWVTAAVSTGLIVLVKMMLPHVKLGIPALDAFTEWTQLNGQTTDIVLGTIVPICLVLGCIVLSKRTSAGWDRLAALHSTLDPSAHAFASRAPAIIVAWSLVGCGAMMAALAIRSEEGRMLLIGYAIMLLTLAVVIFCRSAARIQQPRVSE